MELLKASRSPLVSELERSSEAVRDLANPLPWELERPIVPDRNLKIEVFSAGFEFAPSEVLSVMLGPLNREVDRTNEPDRDLKIEDLSTILETTVRELLKPLNREVLSMVLEGRVNEPAEVR